MKSGKQRRQEIKQKRLERAKKLNDAANQQRMTYQPLYSVEADQSELDHNNTYGPLPLFYVDLPFICRDCGKEEVWTAKQQKWWYEIIKGDINSTAVRCRQCRKIEQERKSEVRRLYLEGVANKGKV